jgi:hypothetical protein
MRRIITVLLVTGCLTLPAAALQSGGAPAAPSIRACTLLTRDLAMQVTPYEGEARDFVMKIAADEDAVGVSGSACTYGGITLQIDPFAPATLDRQRDRDNWVPVANVGDAAYFFDRRGEYAELYVRTGSRVFTIQMDVPPGRTTASIQPNVIALARAILPTL